MPRKNSNARQGKRQKKIKDFVHIVSIDRKNVENMSPGKLVAAAEYKVVEGY